MNEVIISVFPPQAPKSKVLNNNGIVLNDIQIEGIFKNKEYTWEGSFIIDEEGLYKNIERNCILKIKVHYGYEIFRIENTVKDLNYLRVFARQITISDTLDIYLRDVRPENKSALSALQYLKENSVEYGENRQYAKDIEFYSDLGSVSTAYYQGMSLYQALHDCDQSFQNRWGGEVQREGYRVSLLQKEGKDRGYEIRSRKNLQGFEEDINLDNVFTRLDVRGFDTLKLPYFIDSEYLESYDGKILTKNLKYENVKLNGENVVADEGDIICETEEEAYAKLAELAEKEFAENHIDQLKATYNINFVLIGDTEEYKDIKGLIEVIRKGDIVHVYEEKYGIKIAVRVVDIEFNTVRQEITQTTLSNNPVQVSKISISEIIKKLDTIPSSSSLLTQAKELAGNMINTLGKDGYFVYDKNGWAIMDTADKNTATKGWKATLGGIGYFKDGFNSNPDIAMTMDGTIVADFIRAGVLSGILIQSDNGLTEIDLNSGTIKSSQPDGSELVISPQTGFYNKNGNTKREYHHLQYSGYVTLPAHSSSTAGGLTYAYVNLPEEFRDKEISISVSPRTADDYWDRNTQDMWVPKRWDARASKASNNRIEIGGMLAYANVTNPRANNALVYRNDRLTINYTVVA
ncbi:phage tail spike protein [Clostridium paraputrificum]|uniref:phage tail spike protein n=1 Tax=Clostridium paraputrificum TaxID=29363 RepID=UPI00232EC67E|nr:phage tail spike protein [Clostridium paraputrificum]MDB2071372.1 phage tail protein [Clostridium paraputrificum]MDB2081715.1 phage tail protein [Clostridium paraputrificum]